MKCHLTTNVTRGQWNYKAVMVSVGMFTSTTERNGHSPHIYLNRLKGLQHFYTV